MGLFMLPPSLVAMPLKLILFVLADGWLLVATMLSAELPLAGRTVGGRGSVRDCMFGHELIVPKRTHSGETRPWRRPR